MYLPTNFLSSLHWFPCEVWVVKWVLWTKLFPEIGGALGILVQRDMLFCSESVIRLGVDVRYISWQLVTIERKTGRFTLKGCLGAWNRFRFEGLCEPNLRGLAAVWLLTIDCGVQRYCYCCSVIVGCRKICL